MTYEKLFITPISCEYLDKSKERIGTWNNITRVHRVLVFDEAETIHQLDFHNFAGAMGTEVILDVGLSG